MSNLRQKLLEGLVIPAHPLALTRERKLDERRQRALTRYYLAAGVGGVAVGVHTTQFAIRNPAIGLLAPVLTLAAAEVGSAPAVKIAGICGTTKQAIGEAELAASLTYDAGLLSLAALQDATVPELIAHSRALAEILPVFGFYLQPAAGGRILPAAFWRAFVEIENVVAIKIAPFNRYQTLEVIRAVVESGRSREIALYTGNDDSIVIDLLTQFELGSGAVRIVGGLLGHWSVWTRQACQYFKRVRKGSASSELLTLGVQVTDANAALFDAANGFRGCIAGLHEILRRQGLLAGRWCLDPNEDLSPGQIEEIDRVCQIYPHLSDDLFVEEHLDEWLC